MAAAPAWATRGRSAAEERERRETLPRIMETFIVIGLVEEISETKIRKMDIDVDKLYWMSMS